MRNSWQPSSIPVPCLSAPRSVCDSHSVRQTSPSWARHGQHTLIPPSPSRNHHTELQWGIWVPGAPFCTIGFCLRCLLLTSFPETCSPLLPLAAPLQPTHTQAVHFSLLTLILTLTLALILTLHGAQVQHWPHLGSFCPVGLCPTKMPQQRCLCMCWRLKCVLKVNT